MIIPNAKIEKAASNDETRPRLNVVRFDAENERLIAADGWILACLPVEISEGDESCNIQPIVFKTARKTDNRFVIANADKITIPALGEFYNTELESPNIQPIIEHAEDAILNGEHLFSLDVNLLLRLSESLGCSRLKFYRIDNEKFKEMYVVQPVNGKEFGVIMGMHK